MAMGLMVGKPTRDAANALAKAMEILARPGRCTLHWACKGMSPSCHRGRAWMHRLGAGPR